MPWVKDYLEASKVAAMTGASTITREMHSVPDRMFRKPEARGDERENERSCLSVIMAI
jgi:hypothetical protein